MNRKGFTLTEMIFTTIILGLVSVFLSQIFKNMNILSYRNVKQIPMDTQANLAMDRIAKDLQQGSRSSMGNIVLNGNFEFHNNAADPAERKPLYWDDLNDRVQYFNGKGAEDIVASGQSAIQMTSYPGQETTYRSGRLTDTPKAPNIYLRRNVMYKVSFLVRYRSGNPLQKGFGFRLKRHDNDAPLDLYEKGGTAYTERNFYNPGGTIDQFGPNGSPPDLNTWYRFERSVPHYCSTCRGSLSYEGPAYLELVVPPADGAPSFVVMIDEVSIKPVRSPLETPYIVAPYDSEKAYLLGRDPYLYHGGYFFERIYQPTPTDDPQRVLVRYRINETQSGQKRLVREVMNEFDGVSGQWPAPQQSNIMASDIYRFSLFSPTLDSNMDGSDKNDFAGTNSRLRDQHYPKREADAIHGNWDPYYDVNHDGILNLVDQNIQGANMLQHQVGDGTAHPPEVAILVIRDKSFKDQPMLLGRSSAEITSVNP